MSIDLSEFIVASRTGGQRCWYVRTDFTDEQRAKIDAALANQHISSASISRVIESWGYLGVKDGSVQKHAAGRCSCDR
jgi:hypothetical protein